MGTNRSVHAAKALATHPSIREVFLAGHSTGLVALHRVGQNAPLRTWTCNDDLCSVHWLSATSNQFVAVHVNGAVARVDAATDTQDVVWSSIDATGPVTCAHIVENEKHGHALVLGCQTGRVCCRRVDLGCQLTVDDVRQALLCSPAR
jgi:hypothetical protein